MQEKISRLFCIIDPWLRLARMHSPTGWILLAIPCWAGVALAARNFLEGMLWFCLFLIGAFLLRSAGCIVNDIIDRGIDKLVKRTSDRPIASGEISVTEALIFCNILLFLSLPIFISLTLTAKIISFSMFICSLLYPFSKRFFYIPQCVLGILFASGILIGYASILDSLNYNVFMFYVACVMWSIGYDTIYAMQDYEDDKAIGVHSAVVFFKDKTIDFVYALYVLFLTISILSGIALGMNFIFYIFMFLIYLVLREQVGVIYEKKHDCYFLLFKSNIIVGVFYVFGIALGRIGF